MKLVFTILISILLSHSVLAANIVKSKDWTGDRQFIDAVGQRGCVAQTKVEDNGDTFYLQVITMETSNGDYTKPIVIASYDSPAIPDFYEAEGIADSGRVTFNMTLFQNGNADNMVAARMDDNSQVVKRLRLDNHYVVQFLSKNDVVKEVSFSLRGSNKTIKTVLATCK